MDPIISPWIIYLIEVVPGIGHLFGAIATALLVVFVVSILMRFITIGELKSNLERATRYNTLEQRLNTLEEELEKISTVDNQDGFYLREALRSLDIIKENYKEKLFWYLDADKFTIAVVEFSKYYKILLISAAILMLICTFIPTKETMYKMFIASYITPDNINTGVEIGKNSAEYIVKLITDAIIKIKEASGN